MPPFQTTPKPAPALVKEANPPSTSEARNRAIAALMGNSQQSPVQNQNQVTPEEMAAIEPKKDSQNQESGQPDTSVAAAAEGSETPDASQSPSEQPPEATKPKEEPLSSQYAQLARKEKAIRAKVQEMKAREDALKAREQALLEKDSDYSKRYVDRTRLKSETLSVLAEEGISYEQLAEMALNQPSAQDSALLSELKSLKAELQALKGDQENIKKFQTENEQAAYKQAVTQLRSEASKLVQLDPAYETIKDMNRVDDVIELIERTFKEDKILLTVEEAAQQVEDHLIEEAMKIAKIRKIQERLNPKVTTPATPQKQETAKQPQSAQQNQIKTLTNAVGATPKLSARERALLAFKGQLKN